VIDWIERLEMAIEVWNYNEIKLFKIVRLNLRGKVKEWYKQIELVITYRAALKAAMEQKYKALDLKEIRIKFNAIKQEPRKWV
jgi:hypothetical protein